MADANLRENNPRWQQHIETVFRAATDFFEDEFHVEYAPPVIQAWNPSATVASTRDLMQQLKKDAVSIDERGSFDIIVGVTHLPGRIRPGHARVDEIGNCREGLGRFIAIASTGPIRDSQAESLLGHWDVLTLIHELGHLFGAEHVEDRTSIMAVYFNPFSDFDRKNREIILKNRLCPFRPRSVP